MTRVSSPELEREFPAPQGSSKVTRYPARSRNSAVQPPKAPAPDTTRGLPLSMPGAKTSGCPVGFEVGEKVDTTVPVRFISVRRYLA